MGPFPLNIRTPFNSYFQRIGERFWVPQNESCERSEEIFFIKITTFLVKNVVRLKIRIFWLFRKFIRIFRALVWERCTSQNQKIAITNNNTDTNTDIKLLMATCTPLDSGWLWLFTHLWNENLTCLLSITVRIFDKILFIAEIWTAFRENPRRKPLLFDLKTVHCVQMNSHPSFGGTLLCRRYFNKNIFPRYKWCHFVFRIEKCKYFSFWWTDIT